MIAFNLVSATILVASSVAVLISLPGVDPGVAANPLPFRPGSVFSFSIIPAELGGVPSKRLLSSGATPGTVTDVPPTGNCVSVAQA